MVLGQFLLFQGLGRGILFYLVFWLMPIVCMYPMILRLKTITEHFDPGLATLTVCTGSLGLGAQDGFRIILWGREWNFTLNITSFPPFPFVG